MNSKQSNCDRYSASARVRNFWLWVLLASNGVLLVGLAVLMIHYRVPHKAWRRIVVEKRVLGLAESYELNRNYREYRAIFGVYHTQQRGVLVIGDSHVQRVSWGDLLGRDDVAGRGIPGDTVAGLRSRLSDDRTLESKVIVMMIGTNDILNGTPVDLVIQEFIGIITEIQALWPMASVALVSVPPVAAWVESNHERNIRISQVNSWLEKEARRRSRVAYLDIASSMTDPNGNLASGMTSDGVHLSAAAYLLIRDHLRSLF